ncbi:MAG: glycosyltransferase family 4 protein [Candidatus Margulisbacteria bacterium]|nr:glycosyltransferase family 4 protein [Candidatus Margulisiibacteriota bacterium]
MKKLRELLVRDSSKPVVAVITPGSLPVPPILGGGIQTVAYEYAIPNKEQNIIIFSALDAGLPEYEMDKNGIGHVRLRNKSYDNFEIIWKNEYLIRFNRYIYKACRILKSIMPDIVHIHNRPHFVPIVRKLLGNKVKIILTNHNLKIAEEEYITKSLTKVMQAVDLVVYPSRKVAELDLWQIAPEYKEKTAVIYNGVDQAVYKKASPAEINKIREKYKLNSKQVILFIGRLAAEKGADKILEAMPQIIKTHKDIQLVIVGSSFFGKGQKTPYVQKLIEIAKPLQEYVAFTGFVNVADVPSLYSLADIFVAPVTWDDPSPKTIYEAAACEVAIVSVQRGGIPEIVENGKSAVLLDADFTVSDLAHEINCLLHDQNKINILVNNAKERILRNFTCEIIAKQWAELYQKMLSK